MTVCIKNNNNEKSIENYKHLENIGYIVNILCEIIISTDDIQILQKGSALIKMYIPLCSELITKLSQNSILHKTILKYFDQSVSETAIVYLGNLISQYYSHVERKLDINILEGLITLIYKVVLY